MHCRSSCGMLRLPEFVEPIKNVTLTEGSDIEFSCDVRYLGTYRVTWIWHKEDEQKFLSIGVIKIISNPRVHITRLQKSDDVTQFNLYIYNIKEEDSGSYHCSVNSNPMIAQIGTLEVITDSSIEKDLVEKHVTEFPESSTSYDMKDSQTESLSSTEIDMEDANTTNEPCAGGTESCTVSEAGKDPNDTIIHEVVRLFENDNSTELGIDMNAMWETTRERVSDFFSTVIKFTYSYWLS
ncbi:Myosin light chain kinase, smooth muscle [Orchesella cincta]|uniref:Myosin light chain kinase, smooth muscle n=1 Tax=Orchesella cincta TaxID=48709 RepID=A0A1D2MPY2_ORCCI|nr:Myosin light chain kinase, smooth muscle [Orchesella cincta]